MHSIYRARTSEESQRRRNYIEEQEAAKGNVIPFNDLVAAATAMQQDYAVLTGNLRHFRMTPGLNAIASSNQSDS